MPYEGAYTLCEHEGQPGVVVPGFIGTWRLEQKVREAQGLLWSDWADADAAAMAILEHLAGMDHDRAVHLLGFHDSVQIDGRRLYVPQTLPDSAPSPSGWQAAKCEICGIRPVDSTVTIDEPGGGKTLKNMCEDCETALLHDTHEPTGYED